MQAQLLPLMFVELQSEAFEGTAYFWLSHFDGRAQQLINALFR